MPYFALVDTNAVLVKTKLRTTKPSDYLQTNRSVKIKGTLL